jgi:hypothetical protein
MRPWTRCRKSVGQHCSCRHVQGAVHRDVEGSFREGDPSRLSSPSAVVVPQALYDWSVSHLPRAIRRPARGLRPRLPFHHGLAMVSVYGNYLPFTFNLPHILFAQFTFPLYANLVRSRADGEGVQGLHRSVRLSHGRGRQVDAVHRGGCHGPHTTRPFVFVLPRPALLEDEDTTGVRHGGVHRPRVMRQFSIYQESPLPVVHTVTPDILSSISKFNSAYEKIEPLTNMFNLWSVVS